MYSSIIIHAIFGEVVRVIHIDASTIYFVNPPLKMRGMGDREEWGEDFIVEGNTEGDYLLPGPSGQEGQRRRTLLAADMGSEMTATTVGWRVLANRREVLFRCDARIEYCENEKGTAVLMINIRWIPDAILGANASWEMNFRRGWTGHSGSEISHCTEIHLKDRFPF